MATPQLRAIRLWPDLLVPFYVLGFVLLLVVHPLSPEVFLALIDIMGVIPPFAAGIAGILLSRKSEGGAHDAWLLIGLGCLSWGAGEAIWTYFEVVLGRETPFPSLADLGYLGAVPLFFAGILKLITPRDSRVQLRTWLDALAIVAAAAALSWHVIVRQMFTVPDTTEMERVLSSLYPLGDLILLLSLVLALTRLGQRQGSLVLLTLAAGMAAFVIADSLFAYLTSRDAYSAGSLVDVGWVAGMSLFGYAAVLQHRLGAHYRDESLAWEPGYRDLLPIALMPFLLGWLLLTDIRSSIVNADGLPTCVFVIAYAVLVVARQALNHIDLVALSRRLVVTNMYLEARADYLSDRLEEERKLAKRDTLTGVLNRRAVMAEIEQILALPSLVDEVGAIGIIDVDGLKQVNDTDGHAAGDLLLRNVATALCLEGAVVGRVGGDEFVVILPGAGQAQVEAYVALVDWRLSGAAHGESSCSFCAGFAYYPAESKNSRRLLTLADERMYAEKHQKRTSRGGGLRAA